MKKKIVDKKNGWSSRIGATNDSYVEKSSARAWKSGNKIGNMAMKNWRQGQENICGKDGKTGRRSFWK